MKTAEDYIYDFWTENIDEEIGSRNWDKLIEGIKDYSTLVAKEALKNASENVKLTISEFSRREDVSIGWSELTLKENLYIINDGCNIVANKQSILNESNIPKL